MRNRLAVAPCNFSFVSMWRYRKPITHFATLTMKTLKSQAIFILKHHMKVHIEQMKSTQQSSGKTPSRYQVPITLFCVQSCVGVIAMQYNS